MRRMILTSTGFDNKNFEKMFLESINKNPDQIKAVFVPTAANDAESRKVVPFCFQDLTGAGLLAENIYTYNLDYEMGLEELMQYDVIYFCGGSETHLMAEINKMNFRDVLLSAVNKGLFFIGVSAGSMICSASVDNGLLIFDNPLQPHCESNIATLGKLPSSGVAINLSNDQAVWVCGEVMEVIE